MTHQARLALPTTQENLDEAMSVGRDCIAQAMDSTRITGGSGTVTIRYLVKAGSIAEVRVAPMELRIRQKGRRKS